MENEIVTKNDNLLTSSKIFFENSLFMKYDFIKK